MYVHSPHWRAPLVARSPSCRDDHRLACDPLAAAVKGKVVRSAGAPEDAVAGRPAATEFLAPTCWQRSGRSRVLGVASLDRMGALISLWREQARRMGQRGISAPRAAPGLDPKSRRSRAGRSQRGSSRAD